VAIQREQVRMKPIIRKDFTGKRILEHTNLKEVRE